MRHLLRLIPRTLRLVLLPLLPSSWLVRRAVLEARKVQSRLLIRVLLVALILAHLPHICPRIGMTRPRVNSMISWSLLQYQPGQKLRHDVVSVLRDISQGKGDSGRGGTNRLR